MAASCSGLDEATLEAARAYYDDVSAKLQMDCTNLWGCPSMLLRTSQGLTRATRCRAIEIPVLNGRGCKTSLRFVSSRRRFAFEVPTVRDSMELHSTSKSMLVFTHLPSRATCIICPPDVNELSELLTANFRVRRTCAPSLRPFTPYNRHLNAICQCRR